MAQKWPLLAMHQKISSRRHPGIDENLPFNVQERRPLWRWVRSAELKKAPGFQSKGASPAGARIGGCRPGIASPFVVVSCPRAEMTACKELNSRSGPCAFTAYL